MFSPAKIPLEYLKKKDRTIAEMKPGERVKYDVRSLLISHEGEIWVYTNSSVDKQPEPEHSILLQRDQQGDFHVDFEGKKPEISPEVVMRFGRGEVFLPVKSVKL